MQDYSIEKLVIRNGQMISFGDLDDYDKVKTVIIVNDFDIDDDCSNHFSGMKSLERFEVCDEKSRFYTENGVLFANLGTQDRLREKKMFYDIPEDVAGKVLVAFPANYPPTKYSIPDGTVAIVKGAFESTNVEELTLPSSLRFIDFYALDNTNRMRVLKVPNSMKLVVMDHFTMGKQGDFSIVSNNENEELDEDVLSFWKYITEPIPGPEYNEENFGKALYEHCIYPYEILWPNVDSQTKLSIALSDKQNILIYYKKARHSDVDDCIMLALFLFKVDAHLLHPSSINEAELILQMLFGTTYVNESWLNEYAGSSRNYKVLHQLLQSDKVRFLDYVGSSTMHDLLKHRAEVILEPLAEQGYIAAIINLLYIRDVHFLYQSPLLIRKAAELGDPVSMWTIALSADLNKESERAVAVNLWKKLSEGKNLLPYIHKEDIQWTAKNNLRWLELHNSYENAGIYSDENVQF